ncbi:MAG: hypothetical protein PVJ73_13135 [Acidobacteriota bacterium]|jgi:predicted small secreted protein
MMRKTSLLTIAALLGAGLASACAAENGRTEDKKAEKPADSPSVAVIEDDVWLPWRFEPLVWEDSAQVHYRQKEEKAAANELRKAESWLKFAASHSLPESKKALQAAESDLASLAADLEQGNLVDATRLDYALARADHALAQWHYFRARAALGQMEETAAATDLRTAARYLQHAADSARYEYGPDTATFFEDMDEYGRAVDEGTTIEPNFLTSHLTALEREIQKMATTLDEAVKKDKV